jgi:L-lactate utilization protein LutC
MKRITTVLKESEAMAVRKAVCVAGGERIVITPMPQRLCAIDLEAWYCEQSATQRDVHVRLEVTADDSHSGSIVSAIQRIAHAGKIVLASRHHRLPRRAAYNQ